MLLQCMRGAFLRDSNSSDEFADGVYRPPPAWLLDSFSTPACGEFSARSAPCGRHGNMRPAVSRIKTCSCVRCSWQGWNKNPNMRQHFRLRLRTHWEPTAMRRRDWWNAELAILGRLSMVLVLPMCEAVRPSPIRLINF
ncbi:G-protein coupled receptor family C group 6 member A [Anopheles sinensis]|uniref:G-protein coupled receptor family C group 6 member A n=1 Tax=Anopheles sinensis TaxID=74873 RepID=A0A084W458_ANOSI|nr:G-protein coupled receptor family C group 6 member A [Anopheles sinensis]